MIGDWTVRRLPRCTHHVFLSHCAEDRERLVRPVFRALRSARYIPWYDEHHYPVGQGAFEALREGILASRHMVHFVTARFLSQGRGWNSAENAYANLLQENLHFPAKELCHIHLPLFFVSPSQPVLQRSAWRTLVERGRFYPNSRVDSSAAEWAVQEIATFVRRQERRGAALAHEAQRPQRVVEAFGDLVTHWSVPAW
jgi:hypothetical protein